MKSEVYLEQSNRIADGDKQQHDDIVSIRASELDSRDGCTD